MKRSQVIAFAAAALTAFTAAGCSSSPSDDGVEEATGAATSVAQCAKVITPTSPGLKLPEPGSTCNRIHPTDIATIVTAWKKLIHDFYLTNNAYAGYSPTGGPVASASIVWSKPPAGTTPPLSEVAGVPCAPNQSDIVCRFYQHMPSYKYVIPNVRGCFTSFMNGALAIPASTDGKTAAHEATYPEIWDYCMYQEVDAVQNLRPVYNPAEISKNKAAGVEKGVLKYLPKDLRPVFKFIMYTWYEPDTYVTEDQNEILKQVYGSYTPAQGIPATHAAQKRRQNADVIIPLMKAYVAANPTL